MSSRFMGLYGSPFKRPSIEARGEAKASGPAAELPPVASRAAAIRAASCLCCGHTETDIRRLEPVGRGRPFYYLVCRVCGTPRLVPGGAA